MVRLSNKAALTRRAPLDGELEWHQTPWEANCLISLVHPLDDLSVPCPAPWETRPF